MQVVVGGILFRVGMAIELEGRNLLTLYQIDILLVCVQQKYLQ